MKYTSTKEYKEIGPLAYRQWRADSHCKLIHGYRLQCKLWFTADELDDKNWIYDFGGCKEIKNLFEPEYESIQALTGNDKYLKAYKGDSCGLIDYNGNTFMEFLSVSESLLLKPDLEHLYRT